MNFRPLHDRVVVRRIEEDTKTAGGIIIPDTAQEKPMRRRRSSPLAQARATMRQGSPLGRQGWRPVLFGKWSGTEVKIDGEELLIMKEATSWAFWKARSPK